MIELSQNSSGMVNVSYLLSIASIITKDYILFTWGKHPILEFGNLTGFTPLLRSLMLKAIKIDKG
jgi:hypothetical protein